MMAPQSAICCHHTLEISDLASFLMLDLFLLSSAPQAITFLWNVVSPPVDYSL